MTKEPVTRLACELVAALRDRHTQAAVNRALDVGYNLVSKWETGAKKVFWRDFVELSRIYGIDLKSALAEHAGYRGPPRQTAALLKVLTAGVAPKEACAWIGCSRASLSRWLSGRGDAPLAVVLSLLEKGGGLATFIEQLADLNRVPAIAAIAKDHARARDIFARYPEAALLLCCLETQPLLRAKLHTTDALAARVGVPPERMQALLGDLIACKMLGRAGGRYFTIAFRSDIAWTSAETFKKTKVSKLHWSRKSLAALVADRFEQRTCSGGYDLFAVSKDVRAKIQAEVAACRRNIYRLLEEAKDEADAVFLYQYQLTEV